MKTLGASIAAVCVIVVVGLVTNRYGGAFGLFLLLSAGVILQPLYLLLAASPWPRNGLVFMFWTHLVAFGGPAFVLYALRSRLGRGYRFAVWSWATIYVLLLVGLGQPLDLP